MSRLSEINHLPTTVHSIPPDAKGVHESCLRSFHILQEVKRLLVLGTPAEVVSELIEEMEAVRPSPMWIGNTFEGEPPSGEDWLSFLHQCQKMGIYGGLKISAIKNNAHELKENQ